MRHTTGLEDKLASALQTIESQDMWIDLLNRKIAEMDARLGGEDPTHVREQRDGLASEAARGEKLVAHLRAELESTRSQLFTTKAKLAKAEKVNETQRDRTASLQETLASSARLATMHASFDMADRGTVSTQRANLEKLKARLRKLKDFRSMIAAALRSIRKKREKASPLAALLRKDPSDMELVQQVEKLVLERKGHEQKISRLEEEVRSLEGVVRRMASPRPPRSPLF